MAEQGARTAAELELLPAWVGVMLALLVGAVALGALSTGARDTARAPITTAVLEACVRAHPSYSSTTNAVGSTVHRIREMVELRSLSD